MKDDFSARFAALCMLHGLSSRTLARKVKVDESMSSRWLRGETTPRDRAGIVKRALGMTLGQFYSASVPKLRKGRA